MLANDDDRVFRPPSGRTFALHHISQRPKACDDLFASPLLPYDPIPQYLHISILDKANLLTQLGMTDRKGAVIDEGARDF